MRRVSFFFAVLVPIAAIAEPPEPRFRAFTLDEKIQIGYGVAVADVDGDGRLDVLLADKKQFVWYKNPGQPPAGAASLIAPIWNKFVLAENLTAKDNVCIAAQDIDGDGRCEIAVGAEWNPADTETSGAVFYLIPPEDRQQRWTPVKFPSVEPTTHRMRWIRLSEGKWGLLVVPLHGRGNKSGQGEPVKVLLYQPPARLDDPKGEWKSTVVDESMHMTHNFEVTSKWRIEKIDELLLAGKEGVSLVRPIASDPANPKGAAWGGSLLQEGSKPGEEMAGAGEVRDGWLLDQGGLLRKDRRRLFYATIEPMHGNRLVVTPKGQLAQRGDKHQRVVLTDKLTEGHALATGDLLGLGGDQIVVGWRGSPGKAGSTTGVAVWTPLDGAGQKWRETVIDPDGMACEDLQLADLDGDGRLDIVASGRATKNVKIYFSRF